MSSNCNCHNYLDWCFKLCEEDNKKYPSSGDCCCKDAVKYALTKIQAMLNVTKVAVNHFNQFATGGQVDGFVGNDVVSIGGVYVSLCNIIYINFELTKDADLSSMDCNTTTTCCCNKDMESALRTLIGPSATFPIRKFDLSFKIIGNSNDYFHTQNIYGICNGILWIQFQGQRNDFGAIPLCSIFSATK
jgi:hypothetical protein